MAVRAITHRTETYTVTLAVRCADKGREREDELHHREERRAEQREKWEGTALGVCVGTFVVLAKSGASLVCISLA